MHVEGLVTRIVFPRPAGRDVERVDRGVSRAVLQRDDQILLTGAELRSVCKVDRDLFPQSQTRQSTYGDTPITSASSGERNLNISNNPFSRMVGTPCFSCSMIASRPGASIGIVLNTLRLAKNAPMVPFRMVTPFNSVKFSSSAKRCSGRTGSGIWITSASSHCEPQARTDDPTTDFARRYLSPGCSPTTRSKQTHGPNCGPRLLRPARPPQSPP